MPLVDRGVDMLTMNDLHSQFNDISVPLELSAMVLSLCLMIGLFVKKTYSDFPNILFILILFIDFLYAIVMAPLRWMPGNPFYSEIAYPSSEMGCRIVVFVDTFLQVSNMVVNTAIIASVFYMVYFRRTFLEPEKGLSLPLRCTLYSLVIPLGIAAFTAIVGGSHNYIGWCTADSTEAIIKQLFMFLLLVIQVTMILPTNYMLWQEFYKNLRTKAEDKDDTFHSILPAGFFVRFVTTIFTELISIFPLICVEFMGLARKPIPSVLMWCVITLLPAAHWINIIVFSLKFWPTALPMLADVPGCCCCPLLIKLADDEIAHKTEALKLAELKMQKSSRRKKKKKGAQSFFDKMPFWVHLLLTLAIPFLLLAAVSVYMIVDYNDIVRRAEVIREDIVLTTLVSNYIHETQKERGATGVFMGSGRTTFLCEIKAQYMDTDREKKILQFFLSNEFANVKLVTKLEFLKSLINMLGLDEHRTGVENGRIDQKSVGVGWYSNHNMHFVGIVALVCREATLESGTSIAHLIYSNLAFFSAKEKAGVERAKGSAAFGFGRWSDDNTGRGAYRTFVQLVAAQDTHLYFFEAYVSEENLKLYQITTSDKATITSNLMREIALKAVPEEMILVGGDNWFSNMTAKINLIRMVEATLADQLKKESENVVQSTTSAMLYVVSILALVLIVDGLMILGLARTSDHLKRFQFGQEDKEAAAKAAKRKKKGEKDSFMSRSYKNIRNMSFVYQVLIPVLMCGMGLVVVSWKILKTQVKMSQLASSTWENMNLSFYVSNFIHETQKERGATGVYMGSKGAKFGGMWGKLYNQTILCTSKRAILRQFISEEYIDYDDLQNYVGMLFWVDQSNKLEKVRIDVVDFIENGETVGVHFNPISTGAALGFYTTMNKHMVMTLSEMAYRGSSETVEARLLAYLGFMYMKEKAGNERAVGALGMSQSLWPTNADLRKYVSLVAIQQNAYLYFAQFGSVDARWQFLMLQDSKANQILAPWQAAAITNDTSVMATVTGSLWFGNMTEKINEWRIVEEAIAGELNSFFDVLEVETTEFVYAICFMLGFLFLFTTHIGIKGIRLLLKSNAYNIYQQRLRESKRLARLKRKKQKAKAEEKKQKTASS